MKKILLAFMILPTVAFAECPHTYNAGFVYQWVHQCTTALIQSSALSHLPPPFRANVAFYQCTCVIDLFKKNYSQEEAMGMTPEDRALFSAKFVRQCVGNGPLANTN